MNSRIRHALALAVALLALSSGAVSALEVEESIEETYPLEAGGEVSVRNVNGSIEVDAWSRDEVRVVAVKRVRASSRDRADEILERTVVDVDASRSHVSIETELPRSSDGVLSWIFGNRTNARVSYRITVPDRADVTVRTTNGKVRARGIAGRVAASSTNGAIDIAEIRGSVDASTTNGAVTVDLAEIAPNRDMSFSSTNGGIRVTVPKTARISIDASTTNGGIRLDGLQADIRSQSRRRLEADVNGGGPEVDISTTNGGIRIRGS